MRVLHLTTSFPASENDAAGAFIYRLINALNKKGTECHVLTPATIRPATWPDAIEVHRFRYAPWKMQILAQLPGGIPAALHKSLFNFVLLPVFLCSMTLTFCVRARHYDVIHAHWSLCGAIAVITRFFHRKPVIITVHGSDQYKSNRSMGYSLIHCLAVRGAAFTVCVSRDILSDLQKKEPDHLPKFCFIANGVADIFFEVKPRPIITEEPLRLLTIGSLIPLKGIDVIIQSLARIPSSIHWRLTIVGDGIELQNLQKLAEKHALLEYISFEGNVSPDVIPQFMERHHVLILASYREGRPSVVLEAMAAGMAVIATNISGTKELVQNETTGWLFTAGDTNALAEKIESIVKKEKDIITMGLAGRKWMRVQNLTWDESSLQYQQLYAKATGLPAQVRN